MPLADAAYGLDDAHAICGHKLDRTAVGAFAKGEQCVDRLIAFVRDLEKHQAWGAGLETFDKAPGL